MHKILWSLNMWLFRYASGQTDRQTDKHADHSEKVIISEMNLIQVENWQLASNVLRHWSADECSSTCTVNWLSLWTDMLTVYSTPPNVNNEYRSVSTAILFCFKTWKTNKNWNEQLIETEIIHKKRNNNLISSPNENYIQYHKEIKLCNM